MNQLLSHAEEMNSRGSTSKGGPEGKSKGKLVVGVAWGCELNVRAGGVGVSVVL